MTNYPQPSYPVPPAYPPAGSPPGPTPDGPRRHSAFAALVLFWSPKLWRDVGRRWRGIGLRYMFLLLLITQTPTFIKACIGLSRFVRDEAPRVTSQVPNITIQNGIVTADVSQPYYIREPDSGQAIVCIDTTGQVTQPTKEMPIVLTKDSLVVRKETGQIQSVKLVEVEFLRNYQLDSQKAQHFFEGLKTLFTIFGLPVIVGLFLIGRLIQMLIYGAIGLAFSSGFKSNLTYAACMRLAAISVTPVILIDLVLDLTGVPGGCGWRIGGMVLGLVVLLLAVKANAAEQPPGQYGPPGFGAPQQWPAAPQASPYGYAPPGYASPGYAQPQYPYGAPPPPPPNG